MIFRSVVIKAFLLVTALAISVEFGRASDPSSTRSLRGTVYYTNNTPSNLGEFPVEVVARDEKTPIAETTLTESGNFYFDSLKPGKYLLKLTNLGNCTLIYRVDLRRRSLTNVRVIMDAACAHINGKISDLDVR